MFQQCLYGAALAGNIQRHIEEYFVPLAAVLAGTARRLQRSEVASIRGIEPETMGDGHG